MNDSIKYAIGFAAGAIYALYIYPFLYYLVHP